MVNRQEPKLIRMMVLNPADLLRYSLSAPIIAPARTESVIRKRMVSVIGIDNFII